nr:hypothetical protein [Tanacetum cinerariifolium]
RVNVQVSATARPPGKGKAGTRASAKLTVAVIFHYADLAELREKQALPVGLGWTAVSIAYSTVRGMMQARLAGTSFALPPPPPASRNWRGRPAAPAPGAGAGSGRGRPGLPHSAIPGRGRCGHPRAGRRRPSGTDQP